MEQESVIEFINSIKKSKNEILKDLILRSLIGDVLSRGKSRFVVVHGHKPSWVLKIEPLPDWNPIDSSNIAEYKAWYSAKWYKKDYNFNLRKWLAPCKEISSCGRILIQKRTYPITKKEWPKKAPDILVFDDHLENFGKLPNGRIVYHDYEHLAQKITWGERKKPKLVKIDKF